MPSKPNSKRKITVLLSALSTTERSKFIQFVNSPYFNTDQTLVALVSYLNKVVLRKVENKLTAKNEIEAYSAMFGNPKSEAQLTNGERAKLNDKFSRLSALGLKFLTHTALDNEAPEKTNLLLRQLHQKKLTSFFETYRRKEQNQLTQKSKDKTYYLQNYQLERSLFEFQFQYDINKLLKTDNLEKVIEALDTYYLIDRILLHLASMALLTNVGTKSYDSKPMEWILGLSEMPQYCDIPSVKLCRTACYMESYKLQSKETPEKDREAQEHYEELVNLLYQYDQEFTRALKETFYTLAINFCAHQTKLQKNDNFQQKGFELYVQLENRGLMSRNNKVSAGRLINGISFACHSGNYDWAETLFEKYIPQIDKQIRRGVSSFIPGQIAFYRSEFELADQLFKETELQPFHRAYSISCKIFRLKCLYEINKYSFGAAKVRFKSEITARRKSKVLSKSDKESQINYIRILSEVYKTRDVLKIETKPKLRKRLDQIEAKLYSFGQVSDILWLEKKIQDLARFITP